MVALSIKLSSLLFSNELGIRFITIIFMAITSRITWELIPSANKRFKRAELLFFSILMSIPVFSIYGFITTPDASLLCFSAIFLLIIRRFETKQSLINTLIFSVSAALLI